jgi:hypothetical protein
LGFNDSKTKFRNHALGSARYVGGMTDGQVIGLLLAVLLFRPALSLVVPRARKAPASEEPNATSEGESASAA